VVNENKEKKRYQKLIILSIIFITIILFILIIIFYFSLNNFGTLNPLYVVISQSMVPNLNVGGLLIINHKIPFDNPKIRDIIVFTTPGVDDKGNHRVFVHRIVEINKTVVDNSKVIRTKGDANPASIPKADYPIKKQNYIGKVEYAIPKVGLISMYLAPPTNYIVIGVIIIFIVILMRKEILAKKI
jgi:signal peptidase I